MEELLTLLSHIKEDVDFKNSVNLVEDGVTKIHKKTQVKTDHAHLMDN